MKRSLIQLGNKSFSITLPKEWVIKNSLSPKTDLDITDCGNSLIVNTTSKPQNLGKTLVIEDEVQEEIFAKIIAFYRAASKDVKIVFKSKDDIRLLNTIEFVKKFHGVEVETGENYVAFSENFDQVMCHKILKKSFQNILVMSEMLNKNLKGNSWKREINESYERTIFLSEFAIRILNKEGYAEVKEIIKKFALSWIIQCMAVLLKVIARNKKKHNIKEIIHLSSLLRVTYNICFGNSRPKEFFDFIKKANIVKKAKKDSLKEDVFMLQHLCMKIVRQQSME